METKKVYVVTGASYCEVDGELWNDVLIATEDTEIAHKFFEAYVRNECNRGGRLIEKNAKHCVLEFANETYKFDINECVLAV